jgi:CBS domain-containing protein
MTLIKDVMTDKLRTCEPRTTVFEAARLMREEDVGPVPVVDGGRPVGVVTDRDIVLRVVAAGRDPSLTTVGEIASEELVTISPDRPLDEALQLMARHRVRRLPVVEDEKLVGIVAQADVARVADERRTGEVVEEISREG